MTEPEDDWECLSQLGSGGFGIVHVWRSVRSGRRLALKKCKAGLITFNSSFQTPTHF